MPSHLQDDAITFAGRCHHISRTMPSRCHHDGIRPCQRRQARPRARRRRRRPYAPPGGTGHWHGRGAGVVRAASHLALGWRGRCPAPLCPARMRATARTRRSCCSCRARRRSNTQHSTRPMMTQLHMAKYEHPIAQRNNRRSTHSTETGTSTMCHTPQQYPSIQMPISVPNASSQVQSPSPYHCNTPHSIPTPAHPMPYRPAPSISPHPSQPQRSHTGGPWT
eukprot:gene7526-biopygen23